ncbi:MAG: PEPxxWA-CTERM sorting domain-containing protein [Novosphingobium sp.]
MLKRIGLAIAMLTAQPLWAAEVVQTSNNRAACIGCFQGFNTGLGSLDSVFLRIESYQTRFFWVNTATPGPVTWTVDGDSIFRLFSNGTLDTFAISIYDTGTVDVPSGFTAHSANVSGADVFQIDPSIIPVDDDVLASPNFWELSVHFGGPGFYDGSDISFSNPDAIHVIDPGGGDERWNFHTYTLTYVYTPFPGVPEPSTWTMLLLGFGLIGGAMRYRRREQPMVRFAF